jgi:hypothetical protein
MEGVKVCKVSIDLGILERVDAVRPRYMSRTAWINQALERAALEIQQPRKAAALAEAFHG